MENWTLLITVLAPLALLVVFVAARGDDGPRWALPLASLPAVLLALLPPGEVAAPELLLGVRLRIDELARPMLLLIGLAWSAAAWFAAGRLAGRFRLFAIFWLATLAGILVATLAGDLATFYTGYVVMTFAAYGLVLHERTPAAFQAARVYLVLALLGEALLLSGILLIGARLGNADLAFIPGALRGGDAGWAAALLLGGFAVKMGLVPLHVWLPVAHPVAPVAASAILSGVLVKAGLLGALRLVPAAPFESSAWQAALVGLGLFTAFYGVAMGLCQSRLKTVLAYSTVSQMGLLATGLALSLAGGSERGGPLIALLVLHHGLNKAALFLAAGSSSGASRWRLALLALPALSLIGVPLTSGDLAKSALKSALAGSVLGDAALPVLGLASLATALLMLRVASLALAEREARAPLHLSWPLLVLAGLAVPWWQAGTSLALPELAALRDALWPIAAALALAWGWRRLGRSPPAVPPGDLLVGLEAGAAGLGAGLQWWSRRAAWPLRLNLPPLALRSRNLLRRAESVLIRLPAAGFMLLSLAGLLWWALA